MGLTLRSCGGIWLMCTLSVSRKAKLPWQVAATPQYASRNGSCIGTKAGHGLPVAASATASALLSVLPSCQSMKS